MLEDRLPAFRDELQKIAADISDFGVFGVKDIRSWADLDRHLNKSEFRQEALKSTNDPKLKRYIRGLSGLLTSKDLRAYVQSSSTPSKDHQVKALPSGRLACTCRDWQYKHSHDNTDCKHIKRYRQYLKGEIGERSGNP